MFLSLWQQCLIKLQAELSTNEFSRWIRPLQVELNDNELLIYAPNRCVLDWVRDKYLNSISLFLDNFCGSSAPLLRFKVGIKPLKVDILQKNNSHILENSISDPSLFNIGSSYVKCNTLEIKSKLFYSSNVNPKLNFNNFIEGKSNRLARNIAMQVSESPGKIYNPVFLYSSTGLGKTHLLHAVGNNIIDRKHNVKIVYISSESFVKNMVQALQNNVIEQFKLYYRSVDVFLIDDIEFFGNKERSQEEFFHTFNSLLEGNQQIVISANCCPKEIRGVDNRLKSRFSWGLTISIKHPDLDTCVAILMKKAEENDISLPKEVAHFIANNINSNVRELEGALNLVMANSILFGKEITLEFVREVLKDVLILKKKLVAINNIKQTVAEFYKIKVTDLLSKKRSRSISIPRQIAMALSKKLSNCSFLEIGREFGGRDHTTVLHACRKIDHLREEDSDFEEDFLNLIKVLLS